MDIDYEKISLTAHLAAYMRQFSDIPFASDVAELLHSREVFEALLLGQQMTPEDLLWYAPIFEVRYKGVTEAIRRTGSRQVLELASGLTLRGLAFTQDSRYTYIESDLTGISAEKKALIASLRQKYGLPDHTNLHFPTVNALNRSQLKEAAKRLNRNQPLVVVNEGLFQYLSPEEMRTVVGNIRELLSEFQGSWITSDFSIKDEVNQASAQQRNFRRIVTVATGHKMYNNAFDSLEQLLAFLRKMGLKAAVHNPLDEIGEIVSLHRLHLSSSVLDPVKASLRMWVLS
ncbi:MAG: class I SAM-dependent methyltransferase [Anaerolineales bacterium]|jgi:O-methyltransferase involved in polyketide biosynthesis